MLDLRAASIVVTIAVLGSASSASAQAYGLLGSKGDFVIGAERLFGFLSTSETDEAGGVEQNSSATQISLLAGGSSSPYATPRIAFDAFVAKSISIGGTLGLANLSTSQEDTMGVEQDGPSIFAVVVGARAGYVYMFNDTVGLWPKLGVTYFSSSFEFPGVLDQEVSASGLALAIDAALVIMPNPQFGFALAPVLDLGLTGSTDAGGMTPEVDSTITDLGIQAGLFGRL